VVMISDRVSTCNNSLVVRLWMEERVFRCGGWVQICGISSLLVNDKGLLNI
jgi:hypothetical protein